MKKYIIGITTLLFNLFALAQYSPQLGHLKTNELDKINKQLEAIHLYEARNPNGPFGDRITGQGTVVAVVDTGVQTFHPNISSNLLQGYNLWLSSTVTADSQGHGTHVAGTIASMQIGIAPDAKILPITVLDAAGNGDLVTNQGSYLMGRIIQGVDYAISMGANIINLSVGAYDRLKLTRFQWQQIFYKAELANILVVIAAGNSRMDLNSTEFLPARINGNNVITVASCDLFGILSANFSNYGNMYVDICAPGENITSLNSDYFNSGLTKALSGTSMAAPHVSGVAALVWQANPSLNASEVKNIIEQSADNKVGLFNYVYMGRFLNAAKAVKKALE